MATYPPYYAFITYKHPEDAERAIRKMNEEYVFSQDLKNIFL